MNRFCYILFVSFVCLAVSPIFSVADPFDGVIPDGSILYYSYDATKDNPNRFPNYDKAMDIWLETFDDLLEFRVLRSEWNHLREIVHQAGEGASIIGDQYCIAGYPLIEDTIPIGAFLFVTTVDNPTKADHALSAVFDEIKRTVPVLRSERDEYYGYLINTLFGPSIIPGLELSYVINESTLYISNSKPLITRVIEHLEDETGFLRDMEVYQQATAPLPSQRISTFFVNLQKLGQSVEMLTKNLRAMKELGDNEEFNEAFPYIEMGAGYIQGFQSYASASYYQNNQQSVVSAFTRYNLNNQTDEILRLFQREPFNFPFEDYLPRNTGTVSAGNIFNAKDIWNLFRFVVTQHPQLNELYRQFQQFQIDSSFNIEEDFLSWMGDQWCIVRPVMDLNAVIPMNQIAIMIDVNDTEKAGAGIDRLIQMATSMFPLVSESENYRGVTIRYLLSPIPLVPISPSICLHDNLLILTSQTAMLREMLDVKLGLNRGITRKQNYNQVQEIFKKKANKFGYQDNESEFYTYREAIRRLSALPELSQELPQGLETLPTFILDRATYLMSCLRVLKSTAKSSIVSRDQIASTKIQYLQDLNMVPPHDFILRYPFSIGGKSIIALWAEYALRQNDTGRAIRLYTHLARYFPKEGNYLWELAQLHKQSGNLSQAIEAFDQAFQTLPETAYIIGRESIKDRNTVDEILQQVKAAAQETKRVREDAALFGIAIHKRDAGDTNTAVGLFHSILSLYGESSPFYQAAERELAIIAPEPFEQTLLINHSPSIPVLDGVIDEEAWRQAAAYPLIGGGSNETMVRFVQNDNTLYVGMNGSLAAGTKTKAIQLYVCPTRDYTHVVGIEQHPENHQFHAKMVVIDPHGLTLEADKAPNTFQLLPMENIVKDLPTVLQHSIGSYYKSIPIPSERRSDESEMGHAWSLELAIPTDELADRWNRPWLINVVHLAEDSGGNEIKQGLSVSGDTKNPFTFRYIE